MRQHTSAYVSIRQHTSAYVKVIIRMQHNAEVRQTRQYVYFCISKSVSICTLVLVNSPLSPVRWRTCAPQY
jgi:hypothetical protein